jgi:hypothetical protein
MKNAAIRRLSYSSLLELHKCPRKFFLNRHVRESFNNVHLCYGKAFGTGIQEIMKGSSLQAAWFAAFMQWDLEEGTEAEIEKDKKSLWTALLMVSKFANEMWPSLQRSGWEMLWYKGKPSDELGFKFSFFDSFYLVGFIDAILINKRTGEIKVLEIKTTKYNSVPEAMYENSWQAIGYSVILDKLLESYSFQGNRELESSQAAGSEAVFSSYEVLYFILKSGQMDFEVLPFKKTKASKAVWLRNVVQDIERIQRYEEEKHFPMYGESCWDFASFKPCFYFQQCHMSLKGIFLKTEEEICEAIEAKAKKEDEDETYALHVSLDEIIENQIASLGGLSLGLVDAVNAVSLD